ncbi:MAG TPA: tetratricopeptide repeat protein [Verrucomicrobiae bacterium]|jgi:predicted Zn-dependent protease
MQTLKLDDLRLLHAAEGWLGLGNVVEAEAELRAITPVMHNHPEVLAVRYEVLAKKNCWQQCVETAETLVHLAPESHLGWIQRSFALHEMKRTTAALEKLLPAAQLFPEVITIHYNLACYECVLGNLDRSKAYLTIVFKLAAEQDCVAEWRSQLVEDPDLKSLRDLWPAFCAP